MRRSRHSSNEERLTFRKSAENRSPKISVIELPPPLLLSTRPGLASAVQGDASSTHGESHCWDTTRRNTLQLEDIDHQITRGSALPRIPYAPPSGLYSSRPSSPGSQSQTPIHSGKPKQRRRGGFCHELKESFFSVTPFHGFGFVTDSHSILEASFWYCLFTLFLVQTCVDIRRLCIQFATKPTVTTTKMAFNKTISPPDPLLCIPLTMDDFPPIIKEVETGFRTDENGFKPESSPVRYRLIQSGEDVAMVFRNFTDKAHFLDNNLKSSTSSWLASEYANVLIHLALSQLSEISEAENKYGNSAFGFPQYRTVVNTSMVAFDKELQKMNVSYRELSESLGAALFLFLGMEGTLRAHPSFAPGSSLGYRSKLIWTTYTRSCFRVDVSWAQFSSNMDTVTISVSLKGLTKFRGFDRYANNREDQRKEYGIDNHPKMTFSFDDEALVTTYGNELWEVKLGETMYVSLKTEALYTVMPEEFLSGQRRCSEQMNLRECNQLCRFEALVDRCDCIPFSHDGVFKFAAANLLPFPNCTLTHYFKADETCRHMDGTDDGRCASACLHSCTQNVKHVQLRETQLNYEPEFQLQFHIASMIYPIIQETRSYSTQNFLADLGGTLGLWIGGSFLGLIHVLIFFIRSIVERFTACFKIFGRRKNGCCSL